MNEELIKKLLKMLIDEQKKTNKVLEDIRDGYLQDIVYNTGEHE